MRFLDMAQFSVLLVIASATIFQVNSLQCYQCRNCDTVNSQQLLTCNITLPVQPTNPSTKPPTNPPSDTPGQTTDTDTSQSSTATDSSQSSVTDTTESSTVAVTTQSSTVADATQSSTVADTTQSSTVAESTQPSTVTDATQSSTIVDATQSSTVADTTPSSTVADTTQSSTVSESTQPSTVTDATQSSTVADSTQSSIVTDSTHSSTVADTTQSSTVTESIQSSTVTDTILSSTVVDARAPSTNIPAPIDEANPEEFKVSIVKRSIELGDNGGLKDDDCFCQNEYCNCGGRVVFLSYDDIKVVNLTFVCVTDTVNINGTSITNRGCAVQANTTEETCTMSNYTSSCNICETDGCNKPSIAITLEFSSLLLIPVFLTSFVKI